MLTQCWPNVDKSWANTEPAFGLSILPDHIRQREIPQEDINLSRRVCIGI